MRISTICVHAGLQLDIVRQKYEMFRFYFLAQISIALAFFCFTRVFCYSVGV